MHWGSIRTFEEVERYDSHLVIGGANRRKALNVLTKSCSANRTRRMIRTDEDGGANRTLVRMGEVEDKSFV